jgi:hypothetical protein
MYKKMYNYNISEIFINLMSKTYDDLLKHSSGVFLPEYLLSAIGMNIISSSNDKDKSMFYLDGWSFLHFVAGLLMGSLLFWIKIKKKLGENILKYFNFKTYLLILFLFHCIWEIWELFIDVSSVKKLSGEGNIVDILVDTFMYMCGGILMYALIIQVRR